MLCEVIKECESRSYQRQECIPVGCVPSAAVAAGAGGMYPSMHWAVGCLPRGVSAQGRFCPDACWYTHPLVNRITDRCKNITFPQFRLRTVKM